MTTIADKVASDITVFSKYAKHLPEYQRRETWDEIVNRTRNMHIRKFPKQAEQITWAFERVRDKKVLPSMRSFQFAGKAVEINNARLYNCAYMAACYNKFFSELMYLLLGGSGVGYSVQSRHISQLSPITQPKKARKYVIQDSIIGWADAVKALFGAYLEGKYLPVFDYGEIRAKGTPLKTAGGKAPGPAPLRTCLSLLQGLLEAKQPGDRLTSVEVSDMACVIADAVRSGGIRRSAMICLFDIDDEGMLSYKSGEWYINHPERGRANVSAVAFRTMVLDEGWRSGGYSDVIAKATTKELFNKLWKFVEDSHSGEPGIWWTNDLDQGANPCQPKWAKVLTKDGISTVGEISIGDYIWSKEGWTKVINKWSTGVKPVYRYPTTQGVFYGTEEHRLVSNGIKIPAKEAKSVDIICGGLADEQRPVCHRQDVMDGLVIGDGTVHKGSNNLVLLGIGCHDQDYFESEIKHLIKKERKGVGKYVWEIETSVTANELPKTYERRVPSRFFAEDRICGFLRGIYSANGSVCDNRITLKAASLWLIEDVQMMLNSIGIRSYITTNRQKTNQFSNGVYLCRESYDLNITTDRIRFVLMIGFLQGYKNQKIVIKEKEHKEIVTAPILTSTLISEEEVFDITVDNESHTYWSQGCDVSNCNEIALRHKQFCNLCTINYSSVETQEDLIERVTAASIIGTLQASYVDFHYLSEGWEDNCREEALLGISLTGIADGGHFKKFDWQAASKHAVLVNDKFAEIIGINKAARICCIKPEGTASLVLGSSSGVHARHSHYYVRRMRYDKSEALAKYLMTYHPELVAQDVTKPDGIVVELPQKAPDRSIYRTESPIQLLERVKYFHDNWIKPSHSSGPNTHNVSCTVSIKDEEWKEVGEWLWNNKDSYNGLSVLPFNNHSYAQAPFEECTKEEYERRLEAIKGIDLTKVIEEEDGTELAEAVACAGGSCEL